MLHRLRQWWQLPLRERPTLLLLMVLQPALTVSLHRSGFRKTINRVNALSRHPAPRNATEAELEAAERLAQLARIAGRRSLVTTTCLRQALAVYGLLRRRGLQPELKLGVDRQPGQHPDMHAWVELEGIPLAQPQLRHREFQPATSASTASSTEGSAS